MDTVTFTPYRYAQAGQVMRHDSAGDGYKRRADRLAEACGLRWVNRARGYVGTATQCDRVARLLAAGWDARLVLWQGQDFGPGPGNLPEPWMRRRPGLWLAPEAPPPAPVTRARTTISQAQTAAAVARVAAVARDAVAKGGGFKARAQGSLLFAREGEDQAEAVRRLMVATKRRHKAADSRTYPAYLPGMSTADYVALYEHANAISQNTRDMLKQAGDGRRAGTFWAPLNTAPAALYEGGALDFEPVAEVVNDTPAPVQPAAPSMRAQAPAAAAALAQRPSLAHRPRLGGHYTRWLRAPAQEWRVWCLRRALAPLAHLVGTNGASLRRATAGLAAVRQLSALVDVAAPWRQLAAPLSGGTGPPRAVWSSRSTAPTGGFLTARPGAWPGHHLKDSP